MYKLLALDIDGTLLKTDGTVCDSTLESLERVKKENVLVTISTGRPIQGVYQYIELLNLKAPIITYNGAMIIDSKTNNVIYEQQLNREDAKHIIELGLTYDANLIIWSDNKLYVNRLNDYISSYQKLSGEEANVIDDYEIVYNQGVTKIIWANEPEALTHFQKDIQGKVNGSVTYCTSKSHLLEFFDARVSKAKALEFIGKHLNIEKDEMIAIGDGNNDIDMIKYVGMGVAMENATEKVKSVANYITTSNNDKGIYNALEKLI